MSALERPIVVHKHTAPTPLIKKLLSGVEGFVTVGQPTEACTVLELTSKENNYG